MTDKTTPKEVDLVVPPRNPTQLEQMHVQEIEQLKANMAVLSDKLDEQQDRTKEANNKLQVVLQEREKLLMLLKREQAIVNTLITQAKPDGV